MAAAKDADAAGNDAIMCDTLEYVTGDIEKEVAAAAMGAPNEKQSRRRLSAA